MSSESLNDAMLDIDEWCGEHDLPSSSVLDTPGALGIRIYSYDRDKIKGLLNYIKDACEHLHVTNRKVRGGEIITLSVRALSESELNILYKAIEESNHTMSLKDRLTAAMSNSAPVRTAIIDKPSSIDIDFDGQARRIYEAQYKTATMGATRSNQSSLARETHGKDITYAGVLRRGKKAVKESWSYRSEPSSTKRLMYRINEALEGMATPDGAQAPDIFQSFGAALNTVGERMGVGSIQDKLKEQGIKWKKSDDGTEVILYIINGETQAPQPIARISAETISKPNEFEEALFNMIDLSQGREPGAFENYRTKMQEQERAVRDVAKSLAPKDQQQMDAAAASAQAASPKTPGQAPVV